MTLRHRGLCGPAPESAPFVAAVRVGGPAYFFFAGFFAAVRFSARYRAAP